MVRKLGLSSLFYNKGKDILPSLPPPPTPPPSTPAWVWPSCKHPRAQSFRATAAPTAGAGAVKTIASVFLDSAESSFTNSSARHENSESFSTASEASAGDTAEAIVRGLRSERLFFEPGATSSILEKKKAKTTTERSGESGAVFGGGVAVAFDSGDPYQDFRASMEEMVVAHGVGDWDWLEEMLAWYLRANGKDTHSVIVAAFVDLVVAIAASACASCSSRSSFKFKSEGEERGGGVSLSFEIVEEGRSVLR